MGKYNFNLNDSSIKVGGGSPSTKLPPGHYRVRIEKAFLKPSEDKNRLKTQYFISEFVVVKKFAGGEQIIDKHGNLFPGTKEGDYRSWSCDLGYDSGAGALNAYLAAVDGVDPTDPEALRDAKIDFMELLDVALDAKNEMRGVEVDVTTSLKRTKPKLGKPEGNDFMLYQFSPVPSE